MSSTTVAVWEDDPIDAVHEPLPPAHEPVTHDLPDLDPPGLPVRVAGDSPAPDTYEPGSAEFRYWTLADALARGARFWSGLVPRGTTWQPDNGPKLVAVADEGDDLNAFYDRNGLHFFHGQVRGTSVFSGESPDVVCHELGHAVLDAVKPELFEVASAETSAFHESFGDCSAILANLQMESLRDAVLAETGGRLSTASRLSRLAESLGWAIRQLSPDGVADDCLRQAVNSFYYTPPAELPPRAPACSLSSEPHSFSRVFTAGFFKVLAGVFAKQTQDSDGLLQASQDAGKLLVEGAIRARVVPGFFAQVAASMVAADADLFGGRYQKVIVRAFVGTGVLSVHSAAEVGTGRALATAEVATPEDETPPARVSLRGSSYGLPEDLVVRAASQPRRLGVASGMADIGDATAPPAEDHAASFVEDLLRQGRIAPDGADVGSAPIAARAFTSHELVSTPAGLELRRTAFHCGFDAR
ncbi:hypothetical protein [Actinomycetospora termitidis]|uniref:Uncharacterized protein n=1 Tax=Actinomycetospora termitidis TaxID=3053470 RepID=A0ABT7MEE7_9PSEU|nr:hypothetical protein [Actinomycetospora sp. Odt1-22]MDL5159040.1 hypothetical protein [Actinomycetospora sp. Odt1-22]